MLRKSFGSPPQLFLSLSQLPGSPSPIVNNCAMLACCCSSTRLDAQMVTKTGLLWPIRPASRIATACGVVLDCIALGEGPYLVVFFKK